MFVIIFSIFSLRLWVFVQPFCIVLYESRGYAFSSEYTCSVNLHPERCPSIESHDHRKLQEDHIEEPKHSSSQSCTFDYYFHHRYSVSINKCIYSNMKILENSSNTSLLKCVKVWLQTIGKSHSSIGIDFKTITLSEKSIKCFTLTAYL